MTDRIVVASNRGPTSFDRDERGELVAQRGAGGLVTALAGVLPGRDATWIAADMTEGDREVAGGVEPPDTGGDVRMRYIVVEPERYERYYNEVANRTLWFAYHYLWDTVRSPVFGRDTEAAWQDYTEVNRTFAETLAREPGDPAFLIQDYHLSLAPRFLRELRPDARIAHFSHTPFAGSTYLRILPTTVREGVLRGMLGADVLGFQTGTWAENFLFSARGLSGARVYLARQRGVRSSCVCTRSRWRLLPSVASRKRPRCAESAGRSRRSAETGRCCFESIGSSSRRTSREGFSHTSCSFGRGQTGAIASRFSLC